MTKRKYVTDIDGSFLNSRRNPPRSSDKEPAETYEERTERERRADLWGPPEKLPKPKTSRIN